MNNQSAQVLTARIAQELIQELFAGQTVRLQDIKEKVEEVHKERGGLLSDYRWHHPVTYALSRVKRMGLADNPSRGLWSIFSEVSYESEESPQSEEFRYSEDQSEPPIETLKGFMEWVEELPRGEYVYRGVSNKDYPIEASTYRRLKNEKEEIRDGDKSAEKLLQINREMIEEANRHRHGWENEQRPYDLNLLAKLQHSGAATCLIDFTRNPLVALWMACRKSSSGSVVGRVYAVEIGPDSPFKVVSSDDVENMRIDSFFQGNEKTGYQLYQWQPHYQDNRMLAQQSVFLFGGGWGAIKQSATRVISGKHKQEIWDSLKKSAGISEDILFPDFEGFASQRAQNKAYNQPDVPIDTEPALALRENAADETSDDKSQTEFSAIYYLQLSLEAFREGNTEKAINYHSTGMEFEPSDGILNHYYRERALIYYNKGYFQSAINDLDEAIRLDFNEADSYYWRGRSNYELARYTEAISDFDKAISIDPNNAYTYYWCGLSKYGLRQYSQAIDAFDLAINLDPTDTYFYHWRGVATLNLGNYQNSISYFNQAIDLNPAHAYSYHWRGVAKYNLEQYPESIIDFDKAIDLNPTDVRSNGYTYYYRGLAKKQIGVFSAARADFNIALMCAEEIENYAFINLINQEIELETEVRAIPVNTEGEEAAPANFVNATSPGGEIAANGSITVTFDNTPADVTVSAGTVTVAGKTATITGPFTSGPLALTVTWANGTQVLNYTVTAPDTDPPAVTGGTVKDGDKDVDPEAINTAAAIEIEFSEDVSGNVALQTEGGDDVGWLGKVEGNKATLELVKGKEIGNETTYVIAGKVSDAAGNSTDISVTFVTKGKE